MRNEIKESQRVLALVEKLPYFHIGNLLVTDIGAPYLKIMLSRMVKAKKILRLKRGLYVSQCYLNEAKASGTLSHLLEFLACSIYQPSYLSLEYVLYGHNMLTDIPQNFTLMTLNKTKRFYNSLGSFSYHSIKEPLFDGFKSIHEGPFTILIASKAKALFDFLYLRKNIINNKSAFLQLRLNLETMSSHNRKEFKTYVRREGSVKMKYFSSFIL